MKIKILLFVLLVPFSLAIANSASADVAIVRNIVFPVIGKVTYHDDFGDARSGHLHEGNDLMGAKMMPLVSAVDGTVVFVAYPEPSWGYSVWIRDSEGYEYHYLHMNNDTPGTDDGKGGGLYAYAPGIERGVKVTRGQLIGWMGDSGNAESVGAHLHFEIRDPSGTAMDPYQSLIAAEKVAAVTPAPSVPGEIIPYGTFTGGASVALGKFDTSGQQEIVTAASAGGGPLVRVFKKDGTPVSAFYAYSTAFRGGVDVTTGDINGDGIDEIITGAGPGGGPHVGIFNADGTPVGGFFAYASAFRGGVRVAAADIDGDGKAEIITGAGPGGGPHVRIFKSNGAEVRGFFAYDSKMTLGVDVAAYKASGSNTATIVTGTGNGAGPHVRVFDATTATLKNEFFAFDSALRGGVRVSINGNNIIAAPAKSGPSQIKTFTYSGSEVSSKNVFESWWDGGMDVAISSDGTAVSSGVGRQVSVRLVQ